MNRNRRDPSRANFGGHWRFIRAGFTFDEFAATLSHITKWQRLVLDAAMRSLAGHVRQVQLLTRDAYTLAPSVTPTATRCPCGTPYQEPGALCRNCCPPEDQ